ncbi:ATP-binding cassette domain-containing protein [Cellulosimicrobium protaetiae]|uniref:ATP-binding cassette domain-containing protein n=1 Tax=Cellulosimicrobium protaetiae TaxID=2587808 RepID=A0A6M5UFQ2_9MICO|nr:ATP-binding cassette domain-containing protein [Cellulosimicrobium protaetiae]QJW35928.1 ATP-binding cassette domain-containing protein [Cellulosimicrobium protaetiae]
MTRPTTLVVDELSKAFGRRVLWEGLSFTVEPGSMVALTGRSGSGKSTLLNCVGLLEPVTAGRIVVDGADLTRFGRRRTRQFRRDALGYLFQNYALIDNASIDENLAVVARGRGRASRRAAFDTALEQVGLAGRGGEPVYQLSGGEQQRVALARLVVKAPSVVLADEPTGALDHDNADMVVASLRSFAEGGATVVVATHSEQVAAACDRRVDLDGVRTEGLTTSIGA